MTVQELHSVAAVLVAPPRGILAADESVATMSARLSAVGVTPGEDARRDYRELLVRTPQLSTWVSGVILCDETFGQRTADGTPFPAALAEAGLMTGIKVDTGTTHLPFGDGGLITQGLDGLRERLRAYREQGASFAKWRAVVGPTGLGRNVLSANVHALARYAAACQEVGIVPVVEPEFLMEGTHDSSLCQAVTGNVLRALFAELDLMSVDPAGLVLKPNMIVGGTRSGTVADPADVAGRTLRVLTAAVPAQVPGIAFLSGGQDNASACANLGALNHLAARRSDAPWRLTFSFGRALVDDALRTWAGDPTRVAGAQLALAGNCRRASAAAAPAREPMGAR